MPTQNLQNAALTGTRQARRAAMIDREEPGLHESRGLKADSGERTAARNGRREIR